MSVLIKGIQIAMSIAVMMLAVSSMGALKVLDPDIALLMLWILGIPLGLLVVSPIAYTI